MSRQRVLIAGVGNIFLGDDAFGVAVVQRLARRSLPEGVRVVDFGIRGLDLAYALLDDYDAVLLVDAVPRGGPPGTLYVLEPDCGRPPEPGAGDVLVEAHDEAEVRRAVALGTSLVGINNRNLKTLQVDLATTERLAGLVPADRLVVAESGIESRADVERQIGRGSDGADRTTYRLRAERGRPVRFRQLTALVPETVHGNPDRQAARLVGLTSRSGFGSLR